MSQSINDRRLRKAASRAVRGYGLLPEGSRILVALSGGVDSMVLLHLLHHRLLDPPPAYEIVAAHVDPGFGGEAAAGLAAHCKALAIPFQAIDAGHGPATVAAEGENACFLCARRRRRHLFEAAEDLGCDGVALGHMLDDMVETLWMNQCWSAELSTILPRQELFSGRLRIIRPLYLVEKRVIRRFARDHGLPLWENPCPVGERSRRARVRSLLRELTEGNRHLRKNLARAAMNVNLAHLPSPPDGQVRS